MLDQTLSLIHLKQRKLKNAQIISRIRFKKIGCAVSRDGALHTALKAVCPVPNHAVSSEERGTELNPFYP